MLRSAVSAATLVALGSCHGYAPAPVDLDAWRSTFAARLDQARAASREPTSPFAGDVDDGVDLAEARRLALWLHPDARLARAHAGVARVVRDQAGRWPDPQLGVDLERILEDVAHPWLVAAGIGLSVPLSGRLGDARALARERHGAALAEALVAEAEVLRRCDLAFAQHTAAAERRTLLAELVARVAELEAVATRLAAAEELTAAEARAFTLEHVQRRGELQLAEAALAAADLACKRSVGLPPAAAIVFATTGSVDVHVAPRDARSERLATNPGLVLLQARHAVAERELALAVAEQWPDLVVLPGHAEEDGQPRVTLGFQVPLPLFSGHVAAIREAEARREHAAEALRGGFETALHELAAAEADLDAAVRHRAFVETELLPLAERQVADCRRLAELGQLEPLLILDAVVRQHAALDLAVEARLRLAKATIAINALLPFSVPAAAAARETR